MTAQTAEKASTVTPAATTTIAKTEEDSHA
jgi:hypothetical protein